MRFIFLCLLFISFSSSAQEKENVLRIAFYNVENLFDYQNNPDKEDDEFLPSSIRRWTPKRFRHKQEQIARSIASIGEWNIPDLIGLCEIENKNVISFLTNISSLRSYGYRYLITESKDVRGINVALLYQPERFQVINHNCYSPILPPGERPTRDILHVTGLTTTFDTIDVFVCHLPSRLNSTASVNREITLTLLRNKCDSLISRRVNPHIFIMGDFNTSPKDPMISKEFTQQEEIVKFLFSSLTTKEGSYKYNGNWELIDHFYINQGWSNSGELLPPKARIHQTDFLLEKDKKYGGKKPFRTWNGKRYQGGFSDHLPIYVELIKKDF